MVGTGSLGLGMWLFQIAVPNTFPSEWTTFQKVCVGSGPNWCINCIYVMCSWELCCLLTKLKWRASCHLVKNDQSDAMACRKFQESCWTAFIELKALTMSHYIQEAILLTICYSTRTSRHPQQETTPLWSRAVKPTNRGTWVVLWRRLKTYFV